MRNYKVKLYVKDLFRISHCFFEQGASGDDDPVIDSSARLRREAQSEHMAEDAGRNAGDDDRAMSFVNS